MTVSAFPFRGIQARHFDASDAANLSAAEALTLAGLGWSVEKRPVQYADASGSLRVVDPSGESVRVVMPIRL